MRRDVELDQQPQHLALTNLVQRLLAVVPAAHVHGLWHLLQRRLVKARDVGDGHHDAGPRRPVLGPNQLEVVGQARDVEALERGRARQLLGDLEVGCDLVVVCGVLDFLPFDGGFDGSFDGDFGPVRAAISM